MLNVFIETLQQPLLSASDEDFQLIPLRGLSAIESAHPGSDVYVLVLCRVQLPTQQSAVLHLRSKPATVVELVDRSSSNGEETSVFRTLDATLTLNSWLRSIRLSPTVLQTVHGESEYLRFEATSVDRGQLTVDLVKSLLKDISAEERAECLSDFCVHCLRENGGAICHCANDE